jgi:hypothetical protein
MNNTLPNLLNHMKMPQLIIPMKCLFCMSFFSIMITDEIGQTLPKVIPPSPATQQFEKYGDYPVGNFTGVPGISIPLYTIKEGDLIVPITLSYYASGTKPADVSGFTGLGWTINTGGKITRTIMDKADESLPLPDLFYMADQIAAMNNQ